MQIGLKYCGSCNPEVDLLKIVERLKKELDKKKVRIVPLDTEGIDLVLILNACPTSCADREEVRQRAPLCITVNGRMIDYLPVKEEEIPQLLKERIKKEGSGLK